MTEFITNGFQLFTTVICTTLSIIRGARLKSRAYVLLALFSGIFFLGDTYWLLFYLFYSETPNPSFISDLSWHSSYLFLILLLINAKGRPKGAKHSPLLFLAPVFTLAMGIYFMQYGEYLSNLVIALLMALLIWHSLDGLFLTRGEKRADTPRPLYIMTLVFCFIEYTLWVASCIWDGETFANPYYWIDLLLSCTFLFFIPAVGKVALSASDRISEVSL
ncbi:MAG: hypothetical protein J6113_07535 [Lachnospiraceae bacterium]|nr:hypothetical protein [Lachnospiraceae bacterium]